MNLSNLSGDSDDCFYYHLGTECIVSEAQLLGLMEVDAATPHRPSLVVKKYQRLDMPSALTQVSSSVSVSGDGERIWFDITDIGKVLIDSDQSISFQLASPECSTAMRGLLSYYFVPIYYSLRSKLVFRGTAIELCGRQALIIGDAAQGKSTIAAKLISDAEKTVKLVSDGFCLLSGSAKSGFSVDIAATGIVLDQHGVSVNKNIGREQLTPIDGGFLKLYSPLQSGIAIASCNLQAVYVLRADFQRGTMVEVKGLEKAGVLNEHLLALTGLAQHFNPQTTMSIQRQLLSFAKAARVVSFDVSQQSLDDTINMMFRELKTMKGV